MPITHGSEYRTRFNMVMQPHERAQLQALADAMGVKESDAIRQLIQREYAKKFGNKNPGEPRPKYNSKAAQKLTPKRGK